MAPLALIAAVATVIFWQSDAVLEMFGAWLEREEYSHGMLLPLLAAWVIWKQWPVLRETPVRGAWIGAVLTVGGVSLAALGDLATLYTIVQYGIAVMLCGLIVAWLGVDGAKRVWLALVLLVLMVPLPHFFMNNLSAQLQLLSSYIGVGVMRLAGVSVFLEGNVIDLGGEQLQVAEACDGLRYLFPLMTLAFIVAYFFHVPFWKRALLFLASIPIAVLMNSLRVGMIGVLVEHYGISMAEGFMHDFQGWMVFMLSAAVLFALMAWLARIGPRGASWREVFRLEFPQPQGAYSGSGLLQLSPSLTAACVIAVALGAIGLALPERAEAAPLRPSFVEFPMQAGAWQGRREAIDPVYLDVLKLDDYLMADFDAPGGQPVNLYVAYYASQRKGESAHSPRSCIPGGGWQIESLGAHRLGAASGGREVNRVVIERGDQRQIVYYWFEQRGRVVTNEYLVKWYIFWDALTRNRTDGALVRLTAPQLPGQSLEDVDRQLGAFAAQVHDTLGPYVPG